MVDEINIFLFKLKEKYEELIKVTSEIYNLMESEDFDSVQEKNLSQMKMSEELQKISNSFRSRIEEYCKEKGIETLNLRFLFPYFNVEEKEKIIDLQQEVRQLEEQYLQNLYTNLYFSGIKKEEKDRIVQAHIYINQQNGKNSIVIDKEM